MGCLEREETAHEQQALTRGAHARSFVTGPQTKDTPATAGGKQDAQVKVAAANEAVEALERKVPNLREW